MSSNVIKHGVFYGLISMVTTFLLYNGILGTMALSGIGLVAFILILISAGKKHKAENGGFASMGELVKTFSLILIIGLIISTMFQFVYTMTMSEEKKEAFAETMVEKQSAMMAKILPEEQLGDFEDAIYEQANAMFNPSAILIGLLTGAVFSVIISLIPAAIMKKTRPEYT